MGLIGAVIRNTIRASQGPQHPNQQQPNGYAPGPVNYGPVNYVPTHATDVGYYVAPQRATCGSRKWERRAERHMRRAERDMLRSEHRAERACRRDERRLVPRAGLLAMPMLGQRAGAYPQEPVYRQEPAYPQEHTYGQGPPQQQNYPRQGSYADERPREMHAPEYQSRGVTERGVEHGVDEKRSTNSFDSTPVDAPPSYEQAARRN
ncbi:Fc.00g023400.m01.CDS01 [Cosmosporella sp. VM-42]